MHCFNVYFSVLLNIIHELRNEVCVRVCVRVRVCTCACVCVIWGDSITVRSIHALHLFEFALSEFWLVLLVAQM